MRAYNSAFQLASMGCKEVHQPGWNPTFTVRDSVCHRVGSLLPVEGAQPQYLQLYLFEQELKTRANIFTTLRQNVMRLLQDMLHECNAYVRGLRSTMELVQHAPDDIKIIISMKRELGVTVEMKRELGVTALQYHAFHLRYRPGHFSIMPRDRRLFQQLLHQDAVHTETLRGVADAINAGDAHGAAIGRVVLPATFVGGARYMVSKPNDAMAYVCEYGGGDLFITVTCNPLRPEITATLERQYPGQHAQDHPEAVSLVFRQNVRALMTTLRQGGVFGRVRASIYTIEWQKRGLPHAHVVLWLAPEDMPRPDQLDHFVRAEIPDADAEPELHATVTTKMAHGPCGTLRATAPCMVDGVCKKRFPKAFQSITEVHDTGYPRYRRRSPRGGGRTARISGRPGGAVEVDSRWFVPYNPFLSRALDGHVNMEIITHAVTCIRYVIKYVTRGGDQVMFRVSTGDEVVDEIVTYQQGRYLNAMEATWRLLGYPVHEHQPPVQQLPVHLGGDDQPLRFRAGDSPRQVAEDAGADNKLTGFFKLCAEDEFAQTLLCHSVPRYHTWQMGARCWRRRRRGTPHPDVAGIFIAEDIGRVYAVSPRAGEAFFLRLLLHNVRGPRSYEELRTVDGQVSTTFRGACSAHGLLENDQRWHRAMEEVTVVAFPRHLRRLFAVIAVEGRASCDLLRLWRTFRHAMSEDVRRRLSRAGGGGGVDDTEDIDEADGSGGDTQDTEHEPGMRLIYAATLRLIGRHLRRLSGQVLADVGVLHPADTPSQPIAEDGGERVVYNEVMRRLDAGDSGPMFLQAPGGSGKTFLENLLLTAVSGAGGEAITVASSGIATSLLDGGTIAHCRSHIPHPTPPVRRVHL
ncbi:uncharacterized protein LOC119109386 [Pollicipes pollicipes]|uniref:uncharacterized protein LOC119109386 n=1 Tax=Pollicipes pollicipes TaxID=41117 RepID=UPI0018849A51|nr:uncharacterized protein LOC119109386 [Pollicipes pollicipes]